MIKTSLVIYDNIRRQINCVKYLTQWWSNQVINAMEIRKKKDVHW